MKKSKKNISCVIWDKKVFLKTVLLTMIAIALVVIGFVGAGYFAGVFG